jgi:hypothetical protein
MLEQLTEIHVLFGFEGTFVRFCSHNRVLKLQNNAKEKARIFMS